MTKIEGWKPVVGMLVLSIPLVVSAMSLSGCDVADEPDGDTDGMGDSTGAPPGVGLAGVRLRCCYTLNHHVPGGPFEADVGCVEREDSQMCVELANFDADGSGDLSTSEATDACGFKCPPPTDYPFYGGPFESDRGGPLDFPPPYDGCTALFGEINTGAAACDSTNTGHTAPWSAGAAPTHEGTLSSGSSGGRAEVSIAGKTKAVDLAGDLLVAISSCEHRARQEVCTLDLQGLALHLQSSPVFGDYQVDTAQIMLNLPTSTTVSFVCDSSGCSGAFDFVEDLGKTSVTADIAWDQTNLPKNRIGSGSLALGKDRLGSLSRVSGELELDATKSVGTVRIWGDGGDAFGGNVASVVFDLRGAVKLYTP